jgi:hypothetical protein
MKNGQKLKLGDANVTSRNIQEVQASKLEDAPEEPLLHRQKLGHLSTHYIFIASYSMRFFWSIFWRRCTLFFITKNTLFFTLIVQ